VVATISLAVVVVVATVPLVVVVVVATVSLAFSLGSVPPPSVLARFAHPV
jgi:hypothetical protein